MQQAIGTAERLSSKLKFMRIRPSLYVNWPETFGER